MTAYYNEIDPFAAQWLRNLIDAGHIAPGVVDERSIEDVCPDEIREFTQCHFFAGIGVWSIALRIAGWGDDKRVWTGSCPCQPFSAAGKGLGFDDERHLWPAWQWLIQQSKPAILFGEQSANSSEWIDLVRSDLEGMGYAFGAMPIQAASGGVYHLRERIWFVADSGISRLEERISISRVLCEMGSESKGENPSNDPGSRLSWFVGHDGKRRPFESCIHPMADGSASRVGRLRAYGNSIHLNTAVQFIKACAP